MNAIRRGWCPSAFEPMASGDGLLVRIKPHLATITAAQARALAAASLRFGNGAIGLTNRGNFQVRGLREGTMAQFTRAMLDAALVSPDPVVERARNVIVSPLVGDDPGCAEATREIALIAESLLALSKGLDPKFAIAVDGGGILPLGPTTADIAITLSSPPPHAGEGRGEGAQGEGASYARGVGFHHYAGPPRGAFGLAPAFGALDAEGLGGLASLCEAYGNGTLRISPWRIVFITGVRSEHATKRAAAAHGLITTPTDPRLRVIACPGAPACVQATVPTRLDIATNATIHISGCAKGCAHPSAAPITLVGRNGRYDLIRNGRAGDTPHVESLTLAQAAALIAEDAA
ncbi:MAG TPA: hypothetical protein VHS58_17205 [Acetobacteraceae bacterium]|jgi:precorrin-3B synthase|nr:hypothetical protein [Acetobacteraceae bacterium]